MIGILLDETSSERGDSHEKRAGMHVLRFQGNDCFWYGVVTVVLK